VRGLSTQEAAPLHMLMRPGGVRPAGLLLTAAVELSTLLGLQLPNVNGPLLLFKACAELALPEVDAAGDAPVRLLLLCLKQWPSVNGPLLLLKACAELALPEVGAAGDAPVLALCCCCCRSSSCCA